MRRERRQHDSTRPLWRSGFNAMDRRLLDDHKRIQETLGARPPSLQDFFKMMQFSGNFKQILGSGPLWGQNSAGPPDQYPGFAPDDSWRSDSNRFLEWGTV